VGRIGGGVAGGGVEWRRGAMGLEKDGGRVGSAKVGEAKELAADLCKHFYNQGWVSGTGGSITLKVLEPGLDVQEQLIVMAPSGIRC
jgi:methylthioribulose 1-phosphate dehydratase/enolase-phosphatase E1